ncbi:unnamed protein product, partial [Allacma fusca]
LTLLKYECIMSASFDGSIKGPIQTIREHNRLELD